MPDTNAAHDTISPSTLDIIRINGRWAQFYGGAMIKYLDDGSGEALDLSDYSLSAIHRTCVWNAELHGILLTEMEMKNIRWGPEQSEHPYLKLHVTIFGEYAP